MQRLLTAIITMALLFLCQGKILAEAKSMTIACEDYNCLMAQGVEQLKYRNTEAARKLFRQAKRKKVTGKDRIKKATADRMVTKCRRYYPKIFSDQDVAKNLRGSGKYLESLHLLKLVRELARNNAQIIVAEAKDYDQLLIDEISAQLSATDVERLNAIAKAQQRGDELLETKEYAQALAQFNYLDRETLVIEKNKFEVERRLRDAKYGIALLEGAVLLLEGKCANAYEKFIAARDIKNTLEIRGKITEAATCAHDELVALGQAYEGSSTTEDCKKAYEAYTKALTFRPNSELAVAGKVHASKCYTESLLSLADAAFKAKDYGKAKEYLVAAAAFRPDATNIEGKTILEIKSTYAVELIKEANSNGPLRFRVVN